MPTKVEWWVVGIAPRLGLEPPSLACLVSCHVLSVCRTSTAYSIFVPSRRTNCLFPAQAPGRGAVIASARVQAAETCQSQGRGGDFGFADLRTLSLPPRPSVHVRQIGNQWVVVSASAHRAGGVK